MYSIGLVSLFITLSIPLFYGAWRGDIPSDTLRLVDWTPRVIEAHILEDI